MSGRYREKPSDFLRSNLQAEGKIAPPKKVKEQPRPRMRIDQLVEYHQRYKLCPECGQPMLPKGMEKQPGEYDHAQGCKYKAIQKQSEGGSR